MDYIFSINQEFLWQIGLFKLFGYSLDFPFKLYSFQPYCVIHSYCLHYTVSYNCSYVAIKQFWALYKRTYQPRKVSTFIYIICSYAIDAIVL